MLYAVIMAGGSGTRLWPESRVARPKQLLSIEGDRTMLQATVERFGTLVPLERILVATRRDLAAEVQSQLSYLPRGSILAEPCPRNTAPCVGLAAIRIVREDPQGIMAVVPADQIIAPADVFRESIEAASALVEEDARRLVTFGIRPTYPATGFGYIERGEPVTSRALSAQRNWKAYQVARFHEKPTQSVAEQYVAAGRFAWNSGIFVWKAQTILDSLAKFRPDLHDRLAQIAAAADSDRFAEVLEGQFAAMDKVSIDYAVMEQTSDAVVVEAPFAWDDLGGWLAVERYRRRDESGNVMDAPRCLAIHSSGTLVRATDPNHVVVVAGVKDLVVVVTPDATLVANKHDEKSIAAITEQLRQRGWSEHL